MEPAENSGTENADPSLAASVTARLRSMIVDAELTPGAHLAEGRLAERLGVSRNPVREAIRTLDAEGFVNIEPRRGAFVASLHPNAAEDIFTIRMTLEPLGARLAARNKTPEGIEALWALTDVGDVSDDDQMGTLTRLNTAFHVGIFRLSASPHLLSIGTQTMYRSQWIFQYREAPSRDLFVARHRLIFDAIAAGDEDLADAEALRHVVSARRRYRDRAEALETHDPHHRLVT
jgi:DNA-binding GntR family transcriptional regulator